MQISGVAGAMMAMQTAAVAPQAVAPVESARATAGPVDDGVQAAALAMHASMSMPDASTVATMQSLAGLPPAI